MREKLIALLGLKPDATDDQIIAAAEALGLQVNELTEQVGGLQAELASKPAKGAPVDPRIRAKIAAGLTFAQAVEVVAAQDNADKEAKARK